MGAPRGSNPISLAVVVSVMAALLVVFFVGAIAVGYALTTQHITTLQRQQKQQSVPTCRVLKDLAQARNGAIYYDPGNPLSYENRLANDMILLYEKTGCAQITGPLP